MWVDFIQSTESLNRIRDWSPPNKRGFSQLADFRFEQQHRLFQVYRLETHLLFSSHVVPDCSSPHGLQHARLPCPSPSPRVCSNSCPLWRRQWQHTPVLLPGKSHGWGSLVGCSPWGHEESDTTEWLHFHFQLKYYWKLKSDRAFVKRWKYLLIFKN